MPRPAAASDTSHETYDTVDIETGHPGGAEAAPDTENGAQARLEELWSESLENKCNDWLKHAKEQAKLFESMANDAKRMHNFFGLVPIVTNAAVALALTVMSVYAPGDPATAVVAAVGTGFAGVMGAVYKWQNLGQKTRACFDTSAKYSCLADDIEHLLARDPKFREAADSAMTAIRLHKQNIDNSAPDQSDGKGNCSAWLC